MLNLINLTKLTSIGLLGILSATALTSKPASAVNNNALTVTLEAPTVQSTLLPASGTYVVDFNNQSATGGFTKTNGTTNYVYGGDLQVKTQDQWGGASATKYITQADGKSSFNVKVNQDQKYFGFWWSAGDAANKIIFKNDGEEVAVFQTQDLVNFINSRPASEKTAFYGNPNCLSTSRTPTPCGSNTGHKNEPFAYVNVFFNSQVYDEVVIQTLNTGGAKFESDNHTFSAVTQTIRGLTPPVPQRASAANDLVSTSEDNATNDNVLTNDSGENLIVTHVNAVATNVGTPITLASGAKVTLNSNGTFTYNPNGKFDSLNAGQTATDTFSYSIKDNQNNVSTATVTMTIDGTPDLPDAVPDSFTTNEDNSTTGNVKTNDISNAVGSLTVTMVNGIATNVGTPITLNSGALLTLNSDGTFTYNPNRRFESLKDGQNATDTFTYTVTNSHGNTDSATVSMSISGVTDADAD
jgi:VCBS repeat-containing protein